MSTGPGDIKGFEILQRIAARALESESYRQELLDDPKRVLANEGLEVPDEVEVEVHENSAERIHLVLPGRIDALEELDIEEVDVTVFIPHAPF